MTDQDQPIHAVYAGVPTGQNPYAIAPKRQSLTSRQKRGAAWAGIVGFNLLSLGWTLFIVPIMFAAFGALLGFIVNQIGRTSGSLDRGYFQLRDFLDSIDVGLLILPGIGISVLGLAMMAAGILLSRTILKSHSVNRPTAVTWAGAGIAIVGSWFVTWLPSLIGQLGFGMLDASGAAMWASVTVAVILYAVFGFIALSAVGALAWWWMAHAFRGTGR